MNFFQPIHNPTPFLSSSSVRSVVDKSMLELQMKTQALDAVTHFGDAAWSVNQDDGSVVFHTKSGMVVTAPVQIIGSYNTIEKSWLWGWANASINEALRRDAEKVRQYAFEQGINELTDAKIECEESDCWEFTALACKLCDAQAGYRGPAGSTLIFMTFGQVEMTSSSNPAHKTSLPAPPVDP